MPKYDLHVHTTHSGDCDCPIDDIIAVAKSKGLRGIAITDHNTTVGIKEAEKKAGKNLLIIPGVEVSSKDGHILGLGIRKAPPQGKPAAETVAAIRKLGGTAIVAHPFGLCKKPFAILKSDYDAVEVFNPRRYLANRFAKKYVEDHKLAKAAGSDAHHPNHVGLAGVEITGKPTVTNILKQIKTGKAKPYGETLPASEYFKRIIYKAKNLR